MAQADVHLTSDGGLVCRARDVERLRFDGCSWPVVRYRGETWIHDGALAEMVDDAIDDDTWVREVADHEAIAVAVGREPGEQGFVSLVGALRVALAHRRAFLPGSAAERFVFWAASLVGGGARQPPRRHAAPTPFIVAVA